MKLLKTFFMLHFLFGLSLGAKVKTPSSLNHLKKVSYTLASKKELTIYFAFNNGDQVKGLSDTRPEQFADNEALFFYFERDSNKQFWMPHTYFDLDIFFLDEKMRVVAIERNVPHLDPGKEKTRPVPMTKSYWSRHVLEMKSKAPLAQEITIGTQFTSLRIPKH